MQTLQNPELKHKYLEQSGLQAFVGCIPEGDMALVLYDTEEYIYQQEDNLNYLFLVVQGTIKISYISENGKEIIFRILKSPRIIGEIAFILNRPAASTVQALESVYCILLPMNHCRERLLQDPVFLNQVCVNLAEALCVANNKASINQNYTPETRVISYIISIEMNDHFYIDYRSVPSILGISERHLFRIMSGLVKNKLIEKRGNGYMILDKERMTLLSENRYLS